MRISPSVTSSRPAAIRRSVDLPQPEGPTKTTNSPSAMSKSTSRITLTSAVYCLLMFLKLTEAIAAPNAKNELTLDRAGRQTLDEEALAGEEGDQHRQRRYRGCRHHQVVALLELADEEADADGNRLHVGRTCQRPGEEQL